MQTHSWASITPTATTQPSPLLYRSFSPLSALPLFLTRPGYQPPRTKFWNEKMPVG